MQKEEFNNENFLPKAKLFSESGAAQFLGVSRVTLIRLRERQAIGHFRIAARLLGAFALLLFSSCNCCLLTR